MLQCMTKYKNILVIAATSLPWLIGDAFLRRFSKRVILDLPTEFERGQILQQALEGHHHSLKEADFSRLARLTSYFTGDMLRCAIFDEIKRLTLELIDATHFKLIMVGAETRYLPCHSSDQHAVPWTSDSAAERHRQSVTHRPATFHDIQIALEEQGRGVERYQKLEAMHRHWHKHESLEGFR